MKIIVTIIPTVLVTNSLLNLFYPVVETKSKNQIFSKLVVWYKKYLFFLYSMSCSTSKVCAIQDFYKRIFLHAIPVRIIVPWIHAKECLEVFYLKVVQQKNCIRVNHLVRSQEFSEQLASLKH